MNSTLNPTDATGTRLFRLLGLGYLAMIAATWPLWVPQAEFPQVPLVSVLRTLPKVIEWVGLAAVLAAVAGMQLKKHGIFRRCACLVGASGLSGLVFVDQHRFQPWAWQFIVLSLVLATADTAQARRLWQYFVIGIYAWSAWSKLDHSFFFQHGQYLCEGFFKAVGFPQFLNGFPDRVRLVLAALIPVSELLITAGLCSQRTRPAAVLCAAAMHGSLLLILGPLGHNHQYGVLVWNLFFIVQNAIVFRPESTECPSTSLNPIEAAPRFGNRIANAAVMIALVWPILEPFGYCDHWPAWALYAAKPERVTIFVSEPEVSKLPDNLKQYIGTPEIIDGWLPFRIDRWSLDAVRAPVYPQDRFQVGVALAIVRDYDLTRLRIVIEGAANRWTGRRIIRTYDGVESVEKLANSFRCGARPR